MNPDQVFLQAVTGLANAMLLVLVSTGLSLIFGVSRIINLAHGSFYMLGAYFMLTLLTIFGGLGDAGFWVGLVVAALLVAVVGALIEVLLLRRIYQSNELFQLLLTFALVLLLSEAVKIFWGSANVIAPRPSMLAGSVTLFGKFLPAYLIFLIVAGPVVAVGLWVILYRTSWGILIRAATQDREMVDALGVNANLLFTQVFVLASALAGLSGALAAPLVTLTPGMDSSVLLDAFVVVVVGGLGSVGGAVIAALLVGELRAFGILIRPDVATILPFVLMALVLAARPWGILGRPEGD